MRLQRFDRGVALSLITRCDDEDEGFGLGACLKELIYQTSTNAQSKTTVIGQLAA